MRRSSQYQTPFPAGNYAFITLLNIQDMNQKCRVRINYNSKKNINDHIFRRCSQMSSEIVFELHVEQSFFDLSRLQLAHGIRILFINVSLQSNQYCVLTSVFFMAIFVLCQLKIACWVCSWMPDYRSIMNVLSLSQVFCWCSSVCFCTATSCMVYNATNVLNVFEDVLGGAYCVQFGGSVRKTENKPFSVRY